MHLKKKQKINKKKELIQNKPNKKSLIDKRFQRKIRIKNNFKLMFNIFDNFFYYQYLFFFSFLKHISLAFVLYWSILFNVLFYLGYSFNVKNIFIIYDKFKAKIKI